jgi:uncharacterized repeat protein (TIGR03803 family)
MTSGAHSNLSTPLGGFRDPRFARMLLVVLFATVAAGSPSAQTYTVLYNFAGHGDVEAPGGIVQDKHGNLYGTAGGGAFDFGSVFKLDVSGKETLLHSFDGADGLGPNPGLILDAKGDLYGTTYAGGIAEGGRCEYGCGTVFKVDKAGKESVLHAFPGGKKPGSPLGIVRDRAGNFYGVSSGGKSGDGFVFELSQTGKFTILYAFAGQADGAGPTSLVLSGNGILYGTAAGGGDLSCNNSGFGCGVVFELSRGTNGEWSETVLYRFTGEADGSYPGSLISDGAEGFSGTAEGGTYDCGGYGCGLVFKVDKTGNFTILHEFMGRPTDGGSPAALASAGNGILYGVTSEGGSNDDGTIFSLDQAGNETILHKFSGSDGSDPDAIIVGQAGNLYGSTWDGGSEGKGVVFMLTP